MKKNVKKIFTLLLSIIMLLTPLIVAPITVKADDVIPLFVINPTGDQIVVSTATNVTFSARFGGGTAPYAVVWEWSANGTSGWTVADTYSTSDDTAVLTLATVTTAMSGRYYRATVTDSSTPAQVLNAGSGLLTVNTASGTCTAPTVQTNATPASGGTAYRMEGLQILGSEAANSNMKMYVEYGYGTADSIPNPTMASELYTGPVVVPWTETNGQTFVIKAIVTNSTKSASNVTTFSWTIDTTVATLWDIKHDPRYAIWRDANYAKDVPGLTYKHDSHPVNGLTDVYGDTDFYPDFVYDKVEQVLARMQAADKQNMLQASSAKVTSAVFGTRSLLSYGVQSTSMPDGPVGISISTGSETGVFERRNTWYPSAMNLAASFNKDLSYQYGVAWGAEMAYYGVDAMLGPGMNIHRGILNGRNFEYFAEDPLLSGWSSGYVVKGLNSNNVSAQIKHFMSNNQESGRSNRPTYMTTRAIREIYGRNWQYTFDVGNPWAIMTAFNHTNGPHSAQHYDTNTELARYEWGFNGFIGTDIGSVGSSYYNFTNGGTSAGTSSNAQATRVKSGCDLMQNSSGTASVTSGATYITQTLSQVEQDQGVKRMMYYAIKALNFNDKQQSWGLSPQYILDASRSVAAEIGNEGVVLVQNLDLANGKPALPLAKPTGTQRILMVGAANNTLVHGGTGSGQLSVNSKDASSTYPTMITAIGNVGGGSTYVTSNTSASIADSQWTTWSGNGVPYTAVIMSLSRTQGESSDVSTTNRATSTAELTLIQQASNFARAKGIPFIIVLNMCNYIDMEDWYNLADAIVIDWYQGYNGAAPAARVIFNEINPSGKLPDAVPRKTTGTYAGNGAKYYPQEGQFGTSTDIYYYEDIYNGYRYYDTFNVPDRFPFGHGLSYTTFEYSDAKLSKATFDGVNDKITASVTITNTGTVAGKESIQFYIGAPGIEINKPVKELKEYSKTKLLAPGESQTLSVEFGAMSLASYYGSDGYGVSSTFYGQWRVELGHYVVYFASSSKDIRATKSFAVPAAFVAQRALKTDAAKAFGTPLTNLQNASNLIRPTQITVTFNPLAGAAEGTSFQKAYTVMGATYGYLPELPLGYSWVDQATGEEATVDTVVTVGNKTLVAEKIVPKFDINIEVLEWGSAVTHVIIDTKATVSASDVALDTFSVSAVTRNPTNSNIVYNGSRTITNAYVSATKGKGVPATSGRYIVLELKYGFNATDAEINGCAAIIYQSRNYWLNMDYAIVQNKPIAGVEFELEYGSTNRLIYDDFKLVPNPVSGYTAQQYRMYTPEEAGKGMALPLVLWNHGAGEGYGTSGTASNEGAQLFGNMGGIGWVKNAPEACYVLVPQRSFSSYSQAGVIAFINDLIAKGLVDGNRVYVSGCSAGGQETHNYLLNFPKVFAGAIPICPLSGSSLSATQLATIKHIPIWYVHASDDTSVAPTNSQTPYERLLALGPKDVRRTLYPGVIGTDVPNADYAGKSNLYYPNGHWSWVMVLNNKFVADGGIPNSTEGTTYMDWLFAQSNWKPEQGKIVVTQSSDNVSAKVEGYYVNESDKAVNATLILALYEYDEETGVEGRMLSMKASEGVIVPGYGGYASIAEIGPVAFGDAGIAKAFLWDGYTYVPLLPSVSKTQYKGWPPVEVPNLQGHIRIGSTAATAIMPNNYSATSVTSWESPTSQSAYNLASQFPQGFSYPNGFTTNQYIEYTLYFDVPGVYQFSMWYATSSARNNTLNVLLGGTQQFGLVNFAATGGWYTFVTFPTANYNATPRITVTGQGPYVLRLAAAGSVANLGPIILTPVELFGT